MERRIFSCVEILKQNKSLLIRAFDYMKEDDNDMMILHGQGRIRASHLNKFLVVDLISFKYSS